MTEKMIKYFCINFVLEPVGPDSDTETEYLALSVKLLDQIKSIQKKHKEMEQKIPGVFDDMAYIAYLLDIGHYLYGYGSEIFDMSWAIVAPLNKEEITTFEMDINNKNFNKKRDLLFDAGGVIEYCPKTDTFDITFDNDFAHYRADELEYNMLVDALSNVKKFEMAPTYQVCDLPTNNNQ